MRINIVMAGLVTLAVVASASGELQINVTFDDNAYVWTDVEKGVVNQAITDWEEALSGYALDAVVDFGIDHRNEGGAAAITYGWVWGGVPAPGDSTRPWLGTGHYMGVLPWSLVWDATPETDDDVYGYDALSIIRHELGHLLGSQPGFYFDNYGVAGHEDKWTSEIVGGVFDPGGLNVSMAAGDYGHTNGGLMNAYIYTGQRFDVGLTSQMIAKAFDLEFRGDFDFDGDMDADDIDLMSAAVLAGSTDLLYDMDGDGDVDSDDRDLHVTAFANTSLSSFSGTTGVWSGLGTVSADFNLDGTADLIDLATLGDGYGFGTGWATGDTNGDGVVDLIDLAAMGDNYGASAPVPEPATISVMVCGAVALVRRRRRA